MPSASVVVVVTAVSVGCVVRAFSSLEVASASAADGGLVIFVWGGSATAVSAMAAVLKELPLRIDKLERVEVLKAKSELMKLTGRYHLVSVSWHLRI